VISCHSIVSLRWRGRAPPRATAGLFCVNLVLDFAFHVLQLRNVLLETLEWNVAGLTAYERAGFRRIGVRRGARITRGQPTNVVLMDAVPQDFGSSVLR
jgi:diamine N-acetyltransferase